MTNGNTDLLKAALGYAKRGWSVFPLHTPVPGGCSCGKPKCAVGKHPRNQHGLDEATIDEARIRSWWRMWPEANIGIVCGVESGIVALDVDPDHGGSTVLAALEAQFGEVPLTIESMTGGSGRHILFSHPGGNVRNAVGLAGLDGLDLRADGGYIVAPPSLHQSGRRYAWDMAHHPDDVALALMPDWLRMLLQAAAGGNGSKPAGVIGDRIPEKERNKTLTSLAGTMRRRGMPEAAILAALLTMNTDQCDPPLAVDEVRGIAASVVRYPPAPTAPPLAALHAAASGQTFNLTDTGNAERLADRYGKNLRYCYAAGKWYVWDGRYWAPDNGDGVDRCAKLTVRSIYMEAAKATDDTVRKALADHARHSESVGKRKAMIELAHSEQGIPVEPHELDANLWLLNCQNGILDLTTGKLEPHRQDALLTKLCSVAYDPQATCPTWLAFLDRIMAGNQNLIAFLQRAAGYALTGATMEQCLFMLYGTGGNGKSVFLNILKSLLADYAQQATFDTFLHKDKDSVPNDIARMAGTRLVIAIEASEGRRLAESVIKQLTGQDTVTARYMFHDFFEFVPQFKIWLGMNHKPVIRETNNAMWRRVRLVPFTVQIPDEEQDKSLPDLLKTELPGILTWAVQGCLDWQRNGLGVPAEVRDATNSYRDEMDILGGFLNDCCILDRRVRASAKDLYIKYKLWAVDNDEQPISQQMFGRRLADRGLQRAKTTGGLFAWRGIGLQGAVVQSEMVENTPESGPKVDLVDDTARFSQSLRDPNLQLESSGKSTPYRPLGPLSSTDETAPADADKASVERMRAALRAKGMADGEIDRLTAAEAWKLLE